MDDGRREPRRQWLPAPESYWVDEDDLDEYEADYYARTGYTAGDPYGAGASTAGRVGSGSDYETGSNWGDRARATAEGAKEKAEEWRQQATGRHGRG